MEMVRYLPMEQRKNIDRDTIENTEEIRLRVGQPLEIVLGDAKIQRYAVVTQIQMRECLNYLTGYSPYAMEEEMRQGFFTIEGGHRVGISGRVSCHREAGSAVTNCVSDIGAINIRVAHEVPGCAADLIPWMKRTVGWYHTILFSGPGVGKTSCLRDMIRILSSGEGLHRGYKVGVVDERSEIAACHQGVPQNDLGARCDVLDNCPKSVGMRMLLRSMAPEIIAVDELGSEEDLEAVREAMYSGVYVFGTVHAGTMKEAQQKMHLINDADIKGELRWIGLKRCGRKRTFMVYDGQGRKLWES